MLEWRLTLTILLFLTLCTGVVLYSYKVDVSDEFALVKDIKSSEREQESYFKLVDYHFIKQGKRQLALTSDELIFNNLSKRSSFLIPQGHFFTKADDEVLFSAKHGLYRPDDKTFVMTENVEIESEKSQMKSDLATYMMDKDFFVSQGNVSTESEDVKTGDKIFVSSAKVSAWPNRKQSEYLGNVKGKIKRKKIYEPDIYFESNMINLDLTINKIVMEGQVLIKRLDVMAQSLRGEIYLDNGNKKLKYYSLFDDVRLVEKIKTSENRLIERKAFGEKLEGITSEDKLILTGSPKVFQEDDVVKGNKIVLRENNEVIEVEDASSNFNVKKKAP